ncbi:hypothetical protein [Medusavirus stheno T3]|uniref:Uncharacterized protein n=1 Tax=Medusavirus stheno T3 TaxID=3069717 RepID=A0A7S7YEE4_9VIRU|nr:hypothetical protein QKU73_gp068 [Acanthamoeba castellanii medusavirus]QPB44249.1 hypothetical protein [Medusavirus stheno T3]
MASSSFPGGSSSSSSSGPVSGGIFQPKDVPARLNDLAITYKPAGGDRKAPGADIKIKLGDTPSWLRIVTPRLRMPYGLSDNQKYAKTPDDLKFTTDLSLDDLQTKPEQKEILQAVLSIESWVVQQVKANAKDWMPLVEEQPEEGEDVSAAMAAGGTAKTRPMDAKEIARAFTSCVKKARQVKREDGSVVTYAPMLKFKCRKDKSNGVATGIFVDEGIDSATGKRKVSPGHVSQARAKNVVVSLIVEPSSVWFMPATGKFGVSWFVNQVRIHTDAQNGGGSLADRTTTFAFPDAAECEMTENKKRKAPEEDDDASADPTAEPSAAKKGKTAAE